MMGYLKWQDVGKILGSTASIILVIIGIFNLSGMSYTVPQDITCGTDCYSELWVNSTYWEIKVEHAGLDKDIIFKKQSTSRTLWVNLDRVDEFIPTNPDVKVEIMLRTTSKYATIKHEEYGYLRPLKDGDYLVKRQNKNNPNGWKLYIHGSKEAWQTVKWGMDLDSLLMQNIEFDPVWIGEEKDKIINSHIFADGSIGSENFNVTYEHGNLKANYLGHYIELVPFVEGSLEAKQPFLMDSKALPFEKIDKVSYEYNITTSIPENKDYLGFTFNTDLKNIEVENSTIRFGDGESFQITFDFSIFDKESIGYVLNDKEVRIDVKGKTSVDIDPTVTFSTADVENIGLASLDANSFVVGWCDETANTVDFLIYDTNGTAKISKVTVDAAVTSCGWYSNSEVSVSALNSTTFVIGWYDRGAGDFLFSIYDSSGNLVTGPITVESEAPASFSVSVSAFNSTHFVIGWNLRDTVTPAYHTKFSIYDSSGNLVTGPIVADNDNGADSYAVSVSTFNSTAFVIGWFDGNGDDITFSIYDSSGNLKVGPIDADSDAGASSRRVSVSAFNQTSFVIGWYDDTTDSETMSFSTYDSSGTKISGPTDVDETLASASRSSVSVSALNSTTFVIGWYDSTDQDATFAVYSAGTLSAGPTDSSTTALNLQIVSSYQTAIDIGFCEQNFIQAFVVSDSVSNWTSYHSDGTVWDGVCAPPEDETPPTYSLNSTNSTVVSTPCLFQLEWDDDTDLTTSGGHIFSTNNTGVWANASWTVFDTTPDNATAISTLNSTIGTVVGWKFYANDTAGNWNTSVIYTLTTTSAGDSCDYVSGDWNIDCSENCDIDTATDVGGNDIYFTGTGTITQSEDVTNFGMALKPVTCHLIIVGGKKWGG